MFNSVAFKNLTFCKFYGNKNIVYESSPKQAKDVYQRLVFDKLKTNLGMLFENAATDSKREPQGGIIRLFVSD